MTITGETSMHWTKLVLIGPAIAAVIAVAGCDPKPATSAGSTASTKSATTPATSAAASPDDAATKKACAAIKKDIKDNAALVAKVKKIGPPAGHIAVSAQW